MRTERLAAATGAIYVAAIMIGNALATAGGDRSAGSAVLAHLRAGRTPAQTVGTVMEVLAVPTLMIFLAYLYRELRRAEGPDGWGAAAAFGTGLLATVLSLASAGAGVAAVLRADRLTPDLARTLNDLGGGAFLVSGYAFGVFVAVAAGAAFATRALPRWLTISGLVAGVLTVAAGCAGVLDPAGYVPVPYLLCLAWILVASVVLTARRTRSAGPLAERAAGAVPAEAAATA